MNLTENVKLEKDYEQVCVFSGMTIAGEKDVNDLINFIKEEFNVRIQYLECIETGPDVNHHGKSVSGTGGRHDVFFAIHKEDLGRFVIPKIQTGASWIEDVLAKCNYTSPIYPKRVFDYCGWNTEHLASKR
jgi:hypothetical protein